MKKIIFLLLISNVFILSLFGQKKSQDEIRSSFWNADDPYQSIIDIPEKWANESAVIIYQEFNYHYRNSRKQLYYTESTRRRVKLLDKSAIETYSEFSFSERFTVKKGFSKKGGRAFAGFKVIKQNGKEVLIDLEDAVDVKNEGSEVIKKIAIPDLQIGDIIDYFYYIYEPFQARGTHVFDPVISQLGSQYPIMKQKMEFNVGSDFYINFNSINGAPPLKSISSDNKDEVIYQLVDEDQDKYESIRWFYPRRVVPTIKVQVALARKEKSKDGLKAFLGEKREIKQAISDKDLIAYYDRLYPCNPTYDAKNIRKSSKVSAAIKKKDKAAIVREAYYDIRYDNLLSKIEPLQFLEESFIIGLPLSYGSFMDEDDFINKMGYFLIEQKIDFDIVLALSRSISTAKELLMPEEVTTLIRVNLPEPIYLSHFSLHSGPNYFSYYLEGSKSLLIELDKDHEMKKVTPFTMPISTSEENQSLTEVSVSFSEDILGELKIDRQVVLKGHNKVDSQYDLLTFDDIIPEEYKYYGVSPYIERAEIKRKKKPKVKEKLALIAEKNLAEQKKAFEKNAKSDFDIPIKSYDEFKILKQGRLAVGEPLVFTDKMELEGLTKKAGKNYLFEVGKLIGGQVAIAEDEHPRTQDVFMPYPRSFRNEITIAIPAGYSVEGLDKLNQTVKNETGGFIATAKMEGQNLILSTKKYYSHQFEKAANWEDMTKFLEAAYDYTQTKVLLKKL